MDIRRATTEFEKWLRRTTPVDPSGLAKKHKLMAESKFAFLRATYYRWMQLWEEECSSLHDAPRVLSVGDLHIDNFGTWRDLEGRLVWGVNDFDEVTELPYTHDLLRLATSALLALDEGSLRIKPKAACMAILSGYQDGIKSGGRPFVLAEDNPWLFNIALTQLKNPSRFWDKLSSWQKLPKARLPKDVRALFDEHLPKGYKDYIVVLREAGLGSRGQQRFVALAEIGNSYVAREAKALRPSAANWALKTRDHNIHYERVLASSVRVCDPHVHVYPNWLLRRLAPDCTRIELESFPQKGNEQKLLYAMGFETANIHLGGGNASEKIRKDLKSRGRRWLLESARIMKKRTQQDWSAWNKSV